jgi:hypothetical protein
MKPGLYAISTQEKRFLATLDDILYGDEETQADVCHDLLQMIREEAVSLCDSDDEKSKITLHVVQ